MTRHILLGIVEVQTKLNKTNILMMKNQRNQIENLQKQIELLEKAIKIYEKND